MLIRAHAHLHARHVRGLKDEGEGCVSTTHAQGRGLQAQEAAAADGRNDLGSETSCAQSRSDVCMCAAVHAALH